MADDKKKRRADGKRISLTEDYEIRYWTETLGISEAQLIEAVKEVGHMAADVRAFLARDS